MKILVLGSGVIGVSSAWFLNKEGHDVTVIDRQPGPGQETSFANGCQISVSHAEPWANPSAPLKILKWLGKEDAPLLFRLRPELLQWKWGLRFLRECTPARTAENIKQIVAISEYSRLVLQDIRKETGIAYDHLTKGILHFYTEESEFKSSLPAASIMRDLGCNRVSIDASEVVRIEPALFGIKDKIVGGDFTDTDESGDIYKFTSNLEKLAQTKGVNFLYNTQITRFIKEGNNITGVEIVDENGYHKVLKADKIVVAMGSHSQPLLKTVGINLMVYPGKGYSATYKVTNPDIAPSVSITDDEFKLVYSRLGDRLRVAGTCELNGYTRDLNTVRCEAITRRTKEVFPGACDYDNPLYWTGLRPLTPSNVPYIGKSKYENIYINTGHGTLGWTMGAGSGKAIAEIISGKKPDVNFKFL